MLTWRERPECSKAYDYLSKHQTIVVYDTETTGVQKDARIVQISGRKFATNESGSYVNCSTFGTYIKLPFGMLMPPQAAAVNHITDEMLQNAPSEQSIYMNLKNFMGDDNVIVGYNHVKFDNPKVDQLYKRCDAEAVFDPQKNIDVYHLAQEILSTEDVDSGKMTLTNVGKAYGIYEDNMHSSDVDVLCTARLLWKLLNDYIKLRPSENMDGKMRATPSNVRDFKKSRFVNRLYVDVITSIGVRSIYYDRYKKHWTSEDDTIKIIDMLQFQKDIENMIGKKITAV